MICRTLFQSNAPTLEAWLFIEQPATQQEIQTDRSQAGCHRWWNGRQANGGEEIVPASDGSDGDDWGQLHFAGVLHISVDFERFPFKVSELVYDELDKRRTRFICTLTANVW